MTPDQLLHVSEFWFRLLLRMYPKGFRDEMGTGVVEAYRYRAGAILNRSGVRGLAWLWLRAFVDAIRNGLGERLHPAASWRRFGRNEIDATLIVEEVHRTKIVWLVENVLRDAKHAFRVFRHSPAFTLVIVLTLALGIGAATAVFSVLDAVLLQPLPYKQPDRLVAVWGHSKIDPNLPKVFLSYADFDEFRRKATTVEEVSAAAWGPMSSHILSGAGAARLLTVIPVSTSFFSLLGANAAVGRTFSDNDETAGCSIVLANSLWMSAFGGEPALVGRSITLDQKPCSVVGIMPARFAFYPSQAQAWLLMGPDLQRQAGVGVFARLIHAATLSAAQTELAQLYAATNPADAARFEPQVFDLHGEFTFLASRTLRTTLMVALSAVGLLLLIACLNVGNLLLARMSERGREMALRAALGSGQGRLVTQVLTESLILAFFGTLAGVGFAAGAIRYFQHASPIELTVGANVGIHGRVLIFAMLLMFSTAMGFGFSPALTAMRANLVDRLKTGGRATVEGGLARVSIAAQMGISFALLAAAMLLIQSSLSMGAEKLGFELDNRASARFTLPGASYAENSQRIAFYERLEREIAGVDGVRDVALASRVPPDAGGFQQRIEIEGQKVALDSQPINVGMDAVSPSFFGLLKVPLLKGRLFDSRDRPASETVAIVNEELASQYFPSSNPVGKRVRLVSGTTATSPWLTIVGVVGNLKQTMLMNEMRWTVAPHLYRPAEQDPQASMNLLLRFGTSSVPVAQGLKRVAASLDSKAPFGELQPVELQVSGILAYSRFRALVLAFFAISALMLSTIGLHAVLTQFLRKRDAEFGVRRALGATTMHILNLVLRQAGFPVVGGLFLGLILTFVVRRLIASLLYGSVALHPVLLAFVATVLLIASAVAILRPAIAAVRVDPAVALRAE
jgi:putative ABC transport system permease protein